MTDKKLTALDAATAVDYVYGEIGGISKKLALPPLPFFATKAHSLWSRPALATFSTWLNETDGSGTAPTTAVATDNPGGLPLVIRGGLNNNQYFLTGKLKTIGAPPWTITVAVAAFSNTFEMTFSVPIILYDSENDKSHSIYWGPIVVSNQIITAVVEWDGHSATNNLTRLNSDKYGFMFQDYFAWFRIVHDGTNLTYYISAEGVVFEQIHTELAASFLGTIDKVGFGYDRLINNGPAPTAAVMNSILWNWVES